MNNYSNLYQLLSGLINSVSLLNTKNQENTNFLLNGNILSSTGVNEWDDSSTTIGSLENLNQKIVNINNDKLSAYTYEELLSAINTLKESTITSGHISNSSIHVPSSGTTGYVLTKTDSGSEWKEAQTSSSGTTTNVDAVEKLTTLPDTWTSDDSGRVFIWSTSDTDTVKQGHIYKVSSREVTTTTESSGGSGEGFTISGSNNSSYGSFDGTYTPYKTGQGYAGMIYNTGNSSSDETNRTSNIVTTCYANGDKTKFVFEESYLGTIQWIIHTAETLNNSSPPQCCAMTYAWTASGSNYVYYDPTVEQICNDLNWSAGWTSSYTQTTFTKGTWTPLSSSSTTTTSTEYYLEDITVECPVVNAYAEATDTVVYPSLKPYKITADDTIYLGCNGGVSGQVGYAEVVVNVGASGAVLAGDNLTLVDNLTANKINYCVVRWDGLSGQLFVWRTE